MPAAKTSDLVRPGEQDDAAIRRGIVADPDNPEWTAADFAAARPAREALPDLFREDAAGSPRSAPALRHRAR